MGNLDNQLDATSAESMVDINNNERQELSSEMSYDNTNKAIEGLKESQYTLSKEDFQEYFEGEDFEQIMGNCYMIAAIDSLVSFGGYERLIRTSVKKNKNGFSITIPLGSPKGFGTTYFVPFNEIMQNQVNIFGDIISLVKGKLGIKALLQAYGKMCTGKNYYDNTNFVGGISGEVFENLIFGIDINVVTRNIMKGQDEDPDGIADQEFIESFKNTLEMFDKNKDMMTLSVNHKGISYSSLGHYSKSNHAISVEKVRKENGELLITLSDPFDSALSYEITFNELIKSCYRYVICSESINHEHEQSGKINSSSCKNKREYSASEGDQKIRDIQSVNQVVQLTGEENKLVRKARGDIVVSTENGGILIVSSFGMNRNIKLSEKEGNLYVNIYDGNDKLEIPWGSLSKYYKYGGTVEESFNFPFYLYGPKIANFINRMRYDYIDSKKYDVNNKKPFCIKDGSLQFDDDPSKFNGMERAKREGAELFGDDYIECISDWGTLGIESNDNKTKQAIVDFLNKLVNKQK